jgi:hypothetical protein
MELTVGKVATSIIIATLLFFFSTYIPFLKWIAFILLIIAIIGFIILKVKQVKLQKQVIKEYVDKVKDKMN